MLPRISSIWRRDSHPTASGEPGAVHYDFKHLKESIRASVDVLATRLAQRIQVTVAAAATFVSSAALVSSLISAHNGALPKDPATGPVAPLRFGVSDRALPYLDPFEAGIAASVLLLLLLDVAVFDRRVRIQTGAQRFVSQLGRALGGTLAKGAAAQYAIDLAVHAVAFAAGAVYCLLVAAAL